ncbi:type 1 glutamine amidotransferase domain-containing protein [Paraflavitalea sp. CAU 1676]|uniref:type 1 glutamine amidotransferase domain-containing protein n=1 Tax=Paraflavitalea sp. CAU 1676 TaxID=3032598 RepID=UPI0023D9AE1B|nr:type 1 glutamine amidotransferase domain-containing protein [Paraflavitalea sp. CAU 1676]MDF2187023.1 type 1 glutamine amidotransferase [Paraflavitalea sp. CAU 1676]
MKSLSGKRVAILTENGFEEEELTSPKNALEEAGAKVDIVSPQKEKVKAWQHDHWGSTLPVDVQVEKAKAEDYDALMIPGGVINPDQMRTNKHCVEFAQQFLEAGKPVAAICHGPQLLIETGMIDGRNMTSYQSIRTDLINAGVIWVDKDVVTDNGLVTSRSPKDLPAFNKKMIEEITEGLHSPSAYTPGPAH